MKKLFTLVLALVFTAALVGYGAEESATDFETIQASGELKIGITYFEPMNYLDENGELVGFETEFAEAVCEKLGLTPTFVEINWGSKVLELSSGNIDCIWNGMTITPELSQQLSISAPYIRNYQVVVIRKANEAQFRTTADLVGAKIDAEAGSAGEAAVLADENLKQAVYTSVDKQVDALLEVKTGAADACVLDFVLAGAMVGVGDYSDLMVIPNLQLSVEEYGIGLRQNSDLLEPLNTAISELAASGELARIAEKYDLAELLVAGE